MCTIVHAICFHICVHIRLRTHHTSAHNHVDRNPLEIELRQAKVDLQQALRDIHDVEVHRDALYLQLQVTWVKVYASIETSIQQASIASTGCNVALMRAPERRKTDGM